MKRPYPPKYKAELNQQSCFSVSFLALSRNAAWVVLSGSRCSNTAWHMKQIPVCSENSASFHMFKVVIFMLTKARKEKVKNERGTRSSAQLKMSKFTKHFPISVLKLSFVGFFLGELKLGTVVEMGQPHPMMNGSESWSRSHFCLPSGMYPGREQMMAQFFGSLQPLGRPKLNTDSRLLLDSALAVASIGGWISGRKSLPLSSPPCTVCVCSSLFQISNFQDLPYNNKDVTFILCFTFTICNRFPIFSF